MNIKRALIALAGILLFSFGAWAQSRPSPAYRGDRSYSQSRDYNRNHRDKRHRDKHRRDKHRRHEHRRHEHNRYHNDY